MQVVQESASSQLVLEVEPWLETRSDASIRWDSQPVRNLEHLAVCVSLLPLEGFGLADRGSRTEGRWGQTMRTEAGWIVEVHDGTEADFAQRVYRTSHGHYPQRLEVRFELGSFEVFPSYLAAELLWAWLHGGLPLGFDRTTRHFTPDEQRRYGLLA